MSNFHEFVSTTLADRTIDEVEVGQIRERLYADGRLDLDDVKLLVDGKIQPAEQFYLLKMLYSDHQITPRETQFLRSLQSRATETTPEFDALCDEAYNAHPTAWCVGGR